VTFKDLQKIIGQQMDNPEFDELLVRLKDKPFWIWDQQHKQKDIKTRGDCCFNHIIGLPTKVTYKDRCMIMKKYYMIRPKLFEDQKD
jgi:hypothetical protein